MKKIIFTLFLTVLFLISTTPALAHVVVKPNEVKIGAFQTFIIGVPNEKDIPTIGIRLEVPDGLNHVTPNVKPGWNINVIEEGEGDEAKVIEIEWTGGSIPQGFRDDFLFSAQAPSEAGAVTWKAYQTYSDGTVVSWDQEGETKDEDKGPASKTEVIDDLTEEPVKEADNSGTGTTLAIVAVFIATAALLMQLTKKK